MHGISGVEEGHSTLSRLADLSLPFPHLIIPIGQLSLVLPSFSVLENLHLE